MEHQDIIAMARELGKKIQEEESYLKYRIAKQAADEDEELQTLIDEFDRTRTRVSIVASKNEEERNPEQIRELNREMRAVYAKIMTNERMINYNEAKGEFDVVAKRVLAIIQQSAEGEDPETTDYTPSCSGSCASCGGCG